MISLSSSLAHFWQAAQRSRVIFPIMASICFVSTGNSLLTTAISLHLSSPTVDARSMQIVLTAFPTGFLVGCLVAKLLVQRFAHERTFRLVALITALATFGFALTARVPVWFGLRLLNGFSMATLFIVAESWFNLYADPRNRGTYFSLYMLMTSLGVLFGQILVGLGGPRPEFLFLIAAITISTGLVYSKFIGGMWPVLPSQQSLPETTVTPADQRYGLWRLALLAPVTIVGVFEAGTTNMNVGFKSVCRRRLPWHW